MTSIIGIMKRLDESDAKRLEAAGAWLHLGNALEANKELDEITAGHRSHPDVLVLRLEVYCRLEKWEGALHILNALIAHKRDRITFWIQKSQILHKQGRISDSHENLRLARESRPWPIDDLFDLAIEAQKLGSPKEAFACVQDGVGRPGFQQLKNLALATDSLSAIHLQIKTLD